MSTNKELEDIKANLKKKRVRGNLDDLAAKLLKMKKRGQKHNLLKAHVELERTPLLIESLGGAW